MINISNCEVRTRRVSHSLQLEIVSSGLFFRSRPESAARLRSTDCDPYAETPKDESCTLNLRNLEELAATYLLKKRRFVNDKLGYVMLVPTLRCNLACSYCQVSRANEGAAGFDWTPAVEKRVQEMLLSLDTKDIKIEFQGGEPLLRIDILNRVREYCREHFDNPEFVVCSNLQTVSTEAWEFLSGSDTLLSTSLDGTLDLHRAQRTITKSKNEKFVANLKRALNLMGPERVSALPTLDINNLPEPIDVIETYAEFDLRSIFLRPVNYLGFARKQHDALNVSRNWNAYRRRFTSELIAFNARNEQRMEEFYLSHCLRRVFQSGLNNHVDLRSPNPMGTDYLVVDYDGQLYPTDEARMITRTGQMDLSIGSLEEGMDQSKLDHLNSRSTNENDPACSVCAYQPYCGIDLIDDLSRYGTINVERHETEFCRRHMDIFDHIFELIYSDDDAVKSSLAFWLGITEFDTFLAQDSA